MKNHAFMVNSNSLLDHGNHQKIDFNQLLHPQLLWFYALLKFSKLLITV